MNPGWPLKNAAFAAHASRNPATSPVGTAKVLITTTGPGSALAICSRTETLSSSSLIVGMVEFFPPGVELGFGHLSDGATISGPGPWVSGQLRCVPGNRKGPVARPHSTQT